MARVKDPDSFVKGYKIGLKDGKRDALVEFQKTNPNKGLPSNETLHKIFKLLFECQEVDRKTCSVYMNQYERYTNYITENWEKENV